MLIHPQINPVALQLGPLAIHWYGLTYLAAFGLFMFLGMKRLKHQPYARLLDNSVKASKGTWSKRDVEDILFAGVMGVILGGRIGYCLFYKPAYYAAHPLEIFAVWQGGMSFHGGMLGVIVAMVWYAYSRQKPFWQVIDFGVPCVPTGLAAGRIGNFINGELPGRLADPSLPWGMVFRGYGDAPRHPSQIYQFLQKVCCFLYCCGCTPVKSAKRHRCQRRSSLVMACCALRRSFSASRMRIWVFCRWA